MVADVIIQKQRIRAICMQCLTGAKLARTNYYYNRNMTRGYHQHISWKADQVGKNTAHKRYSLSVRRRDQRSQNNTNQKPMGIIDFSPEADPKSAGTPIPNLSPRSASSTQTQAAVWSTSDGEKCLGREPLNCEVTEGNKIANKTECYGVKGLTSPSSSSLDYHQCCHSSPPISHVVTDYPHWVQPKLADQPCRIP